MMLVNDNIALLRKQKGLSSTQLANLINIPQPTLSRYEKGIIKSIPREIIQKIADALGISYEDIVAGDPRYTTNAKLHTPPTNIDDILEKKQTEDEKLLGQYHLLSPELQDIVQRICALASV